jgi:hypothetical protein
MLLCKHAHPQKLSIIDALQLNEEQEYKTRRPGRIVEQTTSFNINDKETKDKMVKTFDAAGMLLTFEFYGDQDSLFARVTYVNDTLNRIKLSRTMEVWERNGPSKETSIYTYDTNNFLTESIDTDANGKTIRRTSIICNEKGHPIELSLFDGKGKFIYKERATYFYNNNLVIRTAETKDGQIIQGDDSSKISLKHQINFQRPDEKYNSNGDLIQWKGNGFFDKDQMYERTYLYDEFENWIESTIFLWTTDKDGQPLKKIKQIVKREYCY